MISWLQIDSSSVLLNHRFGVIQTDTKTFDVMYIAVRVVKEIFNVLKNIQNQNNKLKNNKKKIA